MQGWSIFVGLLGLVGLSSVALADISGGPVYVGGGRMFYVRCLVFNAGPGTATITSHIITTGGSPIELNYDDCGATLAAGRVCAIAGLVVEQVAHSCRFRTTGGVLRGTVAVYSATDALLQSSDMRSDTP